MKRIAFTCLAALCIVASAMADETRLSLLISNPSSEARKAEPVVVGIDNNVRSALVSIDGKEIPCQLDDMNDDGIYDELSFLVDLEKKEKKTAIVTLSSEGEPRCYDARTFSFLSIRDRDKASKQPKHLPIRSVSVPASSNSYQYLFPHGLLLESELVGYRIYGDHRQSVDLYGHQKQQLELSETMFYPSKEQKAGGYGDDVLFTGSTYGCGTLQGWDGKKNVMFENVRTRTFTIISQGPVRAVVETKNKAWKMLADSQPVDVTTRYIIYAGHRDVEVDVEFSRAVGDLELSTGVVDVMSKDSEKLSDGKGLLGCWGTALAGNNPKVYDVHTVGMAVCVPKEYFKGESYFTDTPRELLGTIKDDGKPVTPNQAHVAIVGTSSSSMKYWFTATADTESYGFANSKAWMDYLKKWKKTVLTPISVTTK